MEAEKHVPAQPGSAGNPTVKESVALAEAQEAEALAEAETGVYVHRLSKPFVWEDKTYETLTFRWDTLSGADHLDIENELLMRGRTLVVPEYTGDYLCGMATRTCQDLRNMIPPQRTALLKKLPLGDFLDICGRARNFLFRTRQRSN